MPPSSEICDIPNCDGTAVTTVSPRLDARRQVRPKDRTDTFREGPIISLAANVSENEVSPTLGPSYSFTAAGGWLYTEWSEVRTSRTKDCLQKYRTKFHEITLQCVGWCVGGGVQSRGVRCADPSGCSPNRAPHASQSCSPRKQCDAQWFTGKILFIFSPCHKNCCTIQSHPFLLLL